MARTNIAAQTTPGSYPSLPIASDARDLVFVGADQVDGNSTTIVDNKTIVIVYNTDVASKTVSFDSVADTLNRKGDIDAYSVGAGEVALFGPFKLVGWSQAGKLNFDGSDADLKFAVITLP